MRRVAPLAAIAALSCVAASTDFLAGSVRQDGNLLLNPGAEQGKSGQPSGWFAARVPAEGLRMWQDNQQAYKGQASLAIANTHEYDEAVCNNWAQEVQPVPAEKVIELSSYVKTVDADAVNVCVQCWDTLGETMLAFSSTPVLRGTQDWTQVRARPVLIPADTRSIIVRAALTGVGQAWFDDLSLTVAEGQASATAHPKRGAGRRLALTSRQAAAPDVARRDPALAKLVKGRIVQSSPLSKDCMVLKYIPKWAHGRVDNIAVANNGGGVRTLLAYPEIPADQALQENLRFLIALYSRRVTHHAPAGQICAYEILKDWPEVTSWTTQPKCAEKPAATFEFVPRDGWKIFDITPLVRGQAKAKRKAHGVMLRFAVEDRVAGKKANWSGYAFVSREGSGEWLPRRPMLLTVERASPK